MVLDLMLCLTKIKPTLFIHTPNVTYNEKYCNTFSFFPNSKRYPASNKRKSFTYVFLLYLFFTVTIGFPFLYSPYNSKGRYTRGSLLPQRAPATRSRSKAPSSAPTISSEKICCATELLLPSFAPSYQTGLIKIGTFFAKKAKRKGYKLNGLFRLFQQWRS